jgi:hypothetical protein
MEETNKLQASAQKNGLSILPKELAQVIETKEIFRTQHDLTPAKSFECRKLSSFIKDYPESVYKAVETMIAALAMSTNVKYNIEPYQASDIARAIYKKYYFFSVEEVALVLRMGSEGDLVRTVEGKTLGKIYDRLSKDLILEWFMVYDMYFREPLVSNARQKQNNEYESGQDELFKLLGGEEGIGKIINKLSEAEEEEKRKEENYKEFKKRYFEQKNKENL